MGCIGCTCTAFPDSKCSDFVDHCMISAHRLSKDTVQISEDTKQIYMQLRPNTLHQSIINLHGTSVLKKIVFEYSRRYYNYVIVLPDQL